MDERKFINEYFSQKLSRKWRECRFPVVCCEWRLFSKRAYLIPLFLICSSGAIRPEGTGTCAWTTRATANWSAGCDGDSCWRSRRGSGGAVGFGSSATATIRVSPTPKHRFGRANNHTSCQPLSNYYATRIFASLWYHNHTR